MRRISIIIALILFQSCMKPKATVFEDNRLAQEAEVKFCLIGDLGKDTPFQQTIADALEKENCNRIFFLGDLVYPKGISSGSDPGLEQKFMRYYRPLVDKDPNLIINLILGNHDHKGEPSAWKDVARDNPGFFFPNYYYMIDYGGLCFVITDTSFYYYANKVVEAAEQSTWLLQMQQRINKCDVKIALTHHPLKGTGYDPTDDWEGAEGPLKGYLETYIIGKYDMHIAGHVHILADDGRDDKTRMLISGTGGENRAGSQSGYIVLRWEPGNPKRIGYSLRVIDTDVNVYNEEDGIMKQEAMEDAPQYEKDEPYINKDFVESNWFLRMLNRLRDFLN